jgi:Inner membrane component of T3SS, cytoplasmic domain
MNEATQRSTAPPESQTFVLRVTRGVHRAAVIRLERAGMLVIGSGDDCDVILADAGVASHHCILQKQDNRLLLRAIDGAMGIDGHQHDPGSTLAMRVGASVVIGSATFEVIPTSSLAAPPQVVREQATVAPAPPEVVREEAAPAPAPRPRRAILTSVPMPTIASDEFEARSQRSALGRWMLKSGLNVWLVAAAAVSIVLATVLLAVEFAGRSAQTAVTQPAELAQAISRSADAVAHDVAEVSGLKRVAVSNADRSGDSDQGLPIDGTRIISVVAGADPYVITADGSRYYIGASLPQGGRLAGVAEGEVLVERDGRTEHWNLATRTRQSGEYRPVASR